MKVELIYDLECPNVSAARQNLGHSVKLRRASSELDGVGSGFAG